MQGGVFARRRENVGPAGMFEAGLKIARQRRLRAYLLSDEHHAFAISTEWRVEFQNQKLASLLRTARVRGYWYKH